MAAQVLVVEDDTEMRELLERYLVREGYRVITSSTGAHALRRLRDDAIDLVILDLGLPDVPGAEVLRAAHADGVPVVVVTAKGELQDRIRGLEQGADDYVTKPFSPRELVLRVRAVLHRTEGSPSTSVVRFGAGVLTIDHERHEVTVDGTLVHLTPHEWDFLAVLASHPGRVYSRRELVHAEHGVDFAGYERAVDTHIKNLRQKLSDTAEHPRLIETVLGVGYRLKVPADG
jgi:two-component system alkaline phosphatase synthesis response regulator PhoP